MKAAIYVAGAKEVRNDTGHIFHCVWHKIEIPKRLHDEEDVDRLCGVTLAMAGVRTGDLDTIARIELVHAAGNSLVRVPLERTTPIVQ